MIQGGKAPAPSAPFMSGRGLTARGDIQFTRNQRRQSVSSKSERREFRSTGLEISSSTRYPKTDPERITQMYGRAHYLQIQRGERWPQDQDGGHEVDGSVERSRRGCLGHHRCSPEDLRRKNEEAQPAIRLGSAPRLAQAWGQHDWNKESESEKKEVPPEEDF